MILSNVSIQEALDEGWLIIDPAPSPRESSVEDESPYQTTSVDLRLSSEIVRPTDELPVVVDLRSNRYSALARASSETFHLTEEQPFNLNPKMFVLGTTVEKVTLPIHSDSSPCLAARIEGRSSFARCGLLVHFTAPTIHAGYTGTLTLEMCNFGPYSILLYENMRICQLIIEVVKGRPSRNDSQFQGQTSAVGTK